MHFVRGWCEDPDGERIVASRQGDDVRACFEVEFHEDIEDPLFTFIFRNEVRHTIFVTSSDRDGNAGRFERGDARGDPLRLREPARPEPLHAHRERRQARGGARLLRRGRGHLLR